MPTLEYIGMLLLFFACAYSGYCFSASELAKINKREGFLQLIKYIRSRIDYFREPVDVIFGGFSYKSLDDCGFTACLRENGLKNAVGAYENELAFDSFTKASVTVFTETLGSLAENEQIASCDYLIALLSEELHESKKEYPKRKKLFCTLGILLGASAAIILL